jgi:cytoskeletal protein CcmA (bactofilin family)
MIFGGKEKKAPEKPRPRSKAPTEIETVLGPNTSIQGELCSSGGVRVDGDFGGTIEIAGNLVVGRNAQVKADISAHNVQIQGVVQGDVSAKRLEILDTGKLWGKITVESFVLDDGGFYRGMSEMKVDEESPMLEAALEPSDEVVDVEATVTDES